MRKDLTDITLVVDRSGSMQICKSDAEGGINSFIEEQKKADGDADLTLVQFDTEYDFIHRGTPIQDIPKYNLIPRGMTALLDAVGRGINEVGERLDKIPEDDKPGCVIFVIVTDGHENSSKEFKVDKIREMIEHQQSKYNWKFTFLGADAASFVEATNMGINKDAIVIFNPLEKSSDAYNIASSNVRRMRSSSISGQTVVNSYSQDERNSVQ